MSSLNFKRLAPAALIAAGVATCLLGASGLAFASDALSDKVAASTVTGSAPHTVNSVRVSYRDLDLASASGNRALEERISLAARKVCAAPDIRNLAEMAAGAACERDAVANALADVHSAHPVAQYAVNMARR
jgi:UrcA family protein